MRICLQLLLSLPTQTPTGDLPQVPLDPAGGFPPLDLLATRKVKVISFLSLHVAH